MFIVEHPVTALIIALGVLLAFKIIFAISNALEKYISSKKKSEPAKADKKPTEDKKEAVKSSEEKPKETQEKRGFKVRRNGDDLFVNNKKLTVSIATKSLTSILIHTGINIDSTGAPIAACGLTNDLGITDIEGFAKEILTNYSEEIDDIIMASTKVRGV